MLNAFADFLMIVLLNIHLLIAGCEIPEYYGDNYCDDENNNEACFFDGGDCCGSNVNTNCCTECLCLGGGGKR